MKAWTIRQQINFGYASVLVITALLGAFALWRLHAVTANTTVIVGDCLPGVYTIGKIETEVRSAEMDLREHILSDDTPEMSALETRINQCRDRITQLYTDYEKTITRPEDRALFEKMAAFRPGYLQARTAVLELSRNRQKKEALDLTNKKLKPIVDSYMTAVRALVDYNKRSADDFSARTIAAVGSAQMGTSVGLGAALLTGIMMSVFIGRRTNGSLTKIAGIIRDGANQVAAATGQVSGSSQTLAEGSSEQAASLEETSSSLEELASMTRRNADSAATAKTLSAETRTAAETGNKDMIEMSAAMDAIKTSSNDISKIIKSIDEIAFQTNILALNAAVEAARAGEAGMGFAVVAEEVRALAQRSAASAKETASKIEVAIQNGDHGARISHQVAESLGVIVTRARKVDELIAEIAVASTEQSQGLGQINTAVGQMDKVTQSNAANAEETAAASQELNAQAAVLSQAVASLRQLVDGSRSSDAQPAPTRRPATFAVPARTSSAGRPAARSTRPSAPRQLLAAAGRNDEFFADAKA